MVFSSAALHHHAAAAHAATIAPLDRAAMARPLPQPHVERHQDDHVHHLRDALDGGAGLARRGDAKAPVDFFAALTAAAAVNAAPPRGDHHYNYHHHRQQQQQRPAVAVAPPVPASSAAATKKPKKSPPRATTTSPSSRASSGSHTSTALVSTASAAPTAGAKPAKKLSTERSRLCRQRQKDHAERLERAVTALRAEVANLVTLRDLRREQLVHTPLSRSGPLARIVHEYCAVFEFGMAPEAGSLVGAVGGGGRKRSLAASRQLTAQEQCDFLLSIMDPDVQVFDWIGRTKRGPDPLVHGWKAWSAWHASIMFHLEGVDVIEADGDTIAVSSRGKICVQVSRTTIEQLFPHVASDAATCERLLGAEIRYPFRDTFYFNDAGRVVKYTVDMDCITGLNNVVNDFRKVATLVSPPDDVSFNDRAVCTYEGCSLEEAREARRQELAAEQAVATKTPPRDQRLDLQFLLS